MVEDDKRTGIVLMLRHSDEPSLLLQRLVAHSDWDTVVTVERTPSGSMEMATRTRSIVHLTMTLMQFLQELATLSANYLETLRELAAQDEKTPPQR